MRSNAERVAAVKQRIAEKEREKRRRRERLIVVSASAMSLIFIVGISLCMPSFAEKASSADHVNFGTTASIFSDNGALGYLVIGILAFCLGVSATVLSYRVHLYQREQERQAESHKKEEDM